MVEAMLYEKLNAKKVQCFLCSHYCTIEKESFGFCGVRKNINGILYTYSYGNLIASNIDPIEKKPLFHVLPGSKSYSIATYGCNFRCGFCQNWQISQKKFSDKYSVLEIEKTPEQIVNDVISSQCQSISFTYTEPTIFFEYALDIAKLAKKAGLKTIFVSNGYMTNEAIQTIGPYLDACNIDLKSFRENFYYKYCKAHLKPVLQSIKTLKDAGIWLEITTLLITDENDSVEEITDIANFIANISTDIPWHISRFFPQYEFTDHQPTPIKELKEAKNIGKKAGLKYVYIGNALKETETNCFKCHEVLIKRDGFRVQKNDVVNGKCPNCQQKIGGLWE